MTRFIFTILLALLLVISSCQSRRSKVDSKHLIPEKELVPILTEIYLADALVGMPRIISKYAPVDSSSTYIHIIEKHGYTREQMDKTLKYYFIKNPKKLINIYDKVLGVLSEMESRVKKQLSKSKPVTGGLWTGPDSYSFPDPSGSDSTVFDLSLLRPGAYTLTVNITLFPDDQTANPELTAFTCHPDSILTGKRNNIEPIRYVKDGFEHKYSVSFTVPAKAKLQLRGNLFDYSNNPGNWDKHLIIQNISVLYSVVAI
jgi:hypothetical protein